MHLGEGHVGVDYAEVADRVYFYGDVVAGDDVLRRNVQGFDTEGDAVESFDGPENQIQACAFGHRQEAAEAEDYAAFPFFDDVEGVPEPDEEDEDDDDDSYESDFHFCAPDDAVAKMLRAELGRTKRPAPTKPVLLRRKSCSCWRRAPGLKPGRYNCKSNSKEPPTLVLRRKSRQC